MTDQSNALPVAVDDQQARADETLPARISLTQFCIELSLSDKRVEMIGAFEHSEKRAGRTYDTSAAYADRYNTFTTASPK